MTTGALYSCFFCMLAARALLLSPVWGGALYLIARAAVLYASLRRPIRDGLLFHSAPGVPAALAAGLFALLAALTAVFPGDLKSKELKCLAAVVLCAALRPVLTRLIRKKTPLPGRKAAALFLQVCLLQMLLLPPLFLLLYLSGLDRDTVWTLLGGFALAGVPEAFALGGMGDQKYAVAEQDRQDLATLKNAHACVMFRKAAAAAALALPVTLAMIFSRLADGALSPLLRMAAALLCICASVLLGSVFMRAVSARRLDPGAPLTLGLAAWVCGCALFLRFAPSPVSFGACLSMALCAGGAAVCAGTLAGMEKDMRRADAFALDHEPGDAVDAQRRARLRLSVFSGLTVSLAAFILVLAFSGKTPSASPDGAFFPFGLFIILPALLAAAAAFIIALLFPLTKLHFAKLERYAEIKKSGLENEPLRKQLEAAVIEKSVKCYGIKAIILILYPLLYHKVIGADKIHLDGDTPCVFVCNHGEIYGPIVCVLYVPFPFRPWSAYEIMDESIIADRTMNGIFQDVKGTKRKILSRIMNRIGAPFLAWVMRSVHSIPVYHDNPRKLMQTFRDTIATMQAGDNILLFPENAETSATHRYAREGVSEFFTGFTMIGQLYHAKTGKAPLFVPLYADKRKRTITFGAPTRYDPDAPPNEEKERLCRYLRSEIMKIAGLETEA